MATLEVGKVYKCPDGFYRKLTKIGKDELHFEYPTFHKGQLRWLGLGQAPRSVIEQEFVKGKIVKEDDINCI